MTDSSESKNGSRRLFSKQQNTRSLSHFLLFCVEFDFLKRVLDDRARTVNGAISILIIRSRLHAGRVFSFVLDGVAATFLVVPHFKAVECWLSVLWEK